MPLASQKTWHFSLVKQKRFNLPSILRLGPIFCLYPCPFTSFLLPTSDGFFFFFFIIANTLSLFWNKTHIQTHSSQQIILEGPHWSRYCPGSFLPLTLSPGRLDCAKGNSSVLHLHSQLGVGQGEVQRRSDRGSIICAPGGLRCVMD